MSTEAKLEETVTNWAPVFDFELINLGQHGRSFGGAERDRVFACTGRGHHGAITELRYGVQGRILSAADYISGIRRLFILPDSVGKGYFVLTSFGDHSRLLFLSPAGEEDWNECDDELLVLEEPTLAAGGFEIEGPHVKLEDGEYERMSSPVLQSWAIQITSSAITVATLNGDQYTGDEVEMHGMALEGRKLQRKCRDGEFIVGAAVAGNLAILATRDEGGVTLVLASIVMKDRRWAP